MQFIEGGVTAAKGFLAGGIHCGIRKNKSKADLAMIFSKTPCAAAGVYTQNLVKGAPILVTRKNIADGRAQAVICNSGNANTCNADGEKKAWRMCEIAGEALGIDPHDVIVASTGVIGQILPIAPIENAAPALAALLNENGSNMAAKAIMTTDTIEKECAVKITLGDKEVCIGGISKGSGMIHPNMATMLVFITTDCAISPAMLQKALSTDIANTFNMVSVDGDTSTNDMVTVLANGLAGNTEITAEGEDFTAFMQDALEAVSSAGCCLFSAQTFVPGIFFDLGPNSPITRLVGKIMPWMGPMVALLLNMTPLVAFNSLFILPHAEALRRATGLRMFTGQFLDLGERSYNLERLFNLREGLTAKDDSLPRRLTKELQDPKDPRTAVPLEKMLPVYYKTRGWDKEGRPKRWKLLRLGIEEGRR